MISDNYMNIIKIIISIFIITFCSSSLYAFEWASSARLSLSEEYNDNIYLDRDNEEDDFITIITPGIQTSLGWQRTGLTAAYDLGYSLYNDHSDNNSFRHHGDVGWWWNVFQYTILSLGDTYVKSEDISDLPESDNERGNREGYYSNSARMNLVHRFGENRNVSAGYTYVISDYDDEESDDNKSHNAFVDSTYFFNPHTGLETHVAYTRGLYDVAQDFDEWVGTLRLMRNLSRRFQINSSYTHTMMTYEDDGDDTNYQIYNPSAGIRYIFGEDGTMALNIGYFVQDIDSQDNEKGMTMNGNVGRSWRFKQGTITLSGLSGYENSQLNTENLGFYVYYGADSQFNYQFSRAVTSSFHAAYRHNDYVNSSPDESDRVDELITSGCSLNWQIARWLSSSIEYNFRNLNSNTNENDYTENRIMLRFNAVAQFGRALDNN